MHHQRGFASEQFATGEPVRVDLNDRTSQPVDEPTTQLRRAIESTLHAIKPRHSKAQHWTEVVRQRAEKAIGGASSSSNLAHRETIPEVSRSSVSEEASESISPVAAQLGAERLEVIAPKVDERRPPPISNRMSDSAGLADQSRCEYPIDPRRSKLCVDPAPEPSVDDATRIEPSKRSSSLRKDALPDRHEQSRSEANRHLASNDGVEAVTWPVTPDEHDQLGVTLSNRLSPLNRPDDSRLWPDLPSTEGSVESVRRDGALSRGRREALRAEQEGVAWNV